MTKINNYFKFIFYVPVIPLPVLHAKEVVIIKLNGKNVHHRLITTKMQNNISMGES